MPFLVYKISHGDRLVYIGITTCSLAKRWREHRCAAKTGNEGVLYRAMRKYGEDAFSITLTYEASSKAEMFAVEKGLIAQYGTFAGSGGYNLTSGGDGCCDSPNIPKGEDSFRSVMTTEIVAFVRDPERSGVCNRELRDEVEKNFGIKITRDGVRDARRGESWAHLNSKYPPIKCGQGKRTSELRKKSAIKTLLLPHVRTARLSENANRLRTVRLAAKLTETQARDIFMDQRPNRVIERDYGMSHGTASRIKTRKQWASVTEGLCHG